VPANTGDFKHGPGRALISAFGSYLGCVMAKRTPGEDGAPLVLKATVEPISASVSRKSGAFKSGGVLCATSARAHSPR
jgi:hypothetical protein